MKIKQTNMIIKEDSFLLSGDRCFFTLQGEGQSFGRPAIFLRLHLCNLRCSWCFSGNTLIQTPKRKIKIKNIKKGDKVLSFNGEKIVIDEVIKTYKRKVKKDELLFIKLDRSNEDKIFVTKEHEFFVKGKWLKAEDLQVGDEITSNEYDLWRMVNNNPIQDKEAALIVDSKLNGTTILDLKGVNDKQMARLDGNKDWCYVYNIETKNNNYFAYNLLVHNCDTPYTWNREDKRFWNEPQRWTIKKTINEIKRFPCKRLVITGGEPLLHKKVIDNLLDYLGSEWIFEIETNGTIAPTKKMIERGIQFNCSPKLENSGNLKAVRYRPDILKQLNTLPNTTFKFVVIEPEDLKEIEQIVSECGLDNEKIILMPEGITQEAVAEHGRMVTDLCKEKGWRLIPRLQIMLWGNTRTK